MAVSITHNGLVVAKQSGEGGVWLSQVPQVGDIVTLESPGFVTAVTYDGLPSSEPTVCAGSNNFSGQRTGGYTASKVVTTQSGPTLGTSPGATAAWLRFRCLPDRASAATSLATRQWRYRLRRRVADFASRWWRDVHLTRSENDRPVGGVRRRLLLRLLRRSRLPGRSRNSRGSRSPSCFAPDGSTHVTINQPGTIVEGLYQHSGILPAFAATSKTKRPRKSQGTAARSGDDHRQSGGHGDSHDASHLRGSAPAQARTQRQSGADRDADGQLGRQVLPGCHFLTLHRYNHVSSWRNRGYRPRPVDPDGRRARVGLGSTLKRVLQAAWVLLSAIAWLQPPAVLPVPSRTGADGPPRPYGAEPPAGAVPSNSDPSIVRAQNHALLYGPFPAPGGTHAGRVRRRPDAERKRLGSRADDEQGAGARGERGAHSHGLAQRRASESAGGLQARDPASPGYATSPS